MAVEAYWLSLMMSAGTSAAGAWWCLRQISQARHLLDTPTSKIRSAAQGYVEFYGVITEQPDNLLVGPLTGKPCVWWRFKIEEHVQDDKKRTWRSLESGVSDALLALSDGTGDCLINPKGAQVRTTTREVWNGSQRHPRIANKGGMLGFLSMGKKYRYTEERLHVGQPLYAIGDFRSSGGGRQGLDLAAQQGAVIREWKSDFSGLLQRFDSDKNGQLDEQEWSRVRLAAQLEAEDRHRQQSLEPAVHQLAKPRESQPFVLSTTGEDELARGFYWQAAGAAVVCLAGALSLAWQLRIL
ncbi:GIDE domain-containing protein [Pseudomonas sp. NPDC078700]|uniref:GIDE domain-containing protein n=1 Tax=Pseudomonas sp. NPDC078700 TaxID=3364424 RepID=UPI0037CBA0C2